MLAVRDLSIGNYLKRNGVVVTIDARSIFDIWNDEGINKLGYEPIPITMELMERFGFVFVVVSVFERRNGAVVGSFWKG